MTLRFSVALVALASAAFGTVSCSGGGSSEPSHVPTTLSALVTPGATALVGTAVAAPSVRVTDGGAQPVKGVPVTFFVTGGGLVTATSSTTDDAGTASPGTWTMGNTAGLNTLTATVSNVTPLMFSVTATVSTPNLVSKVSGDNQAGVVATPLSVAPSVRVADSFGNPVSGLTVNFAITGGGGSVTGGTQTTNGLGVATVGGWTMGTIAGTNTLTASVPGLTAALFTATAAAGPASVIAKVAGDNQSGVTGGAVTVAPSVKVQDSFGNALRATAVTFAVATGAGSVTGGAQITSDQGVATVGSWRLGQTPGVNTLTATVTGLPPATFTATSVLGTDLCTTGFGTLSLGTPVSGSLTTSDCLLSTGEYSDFYTLTVPTAQALLLTQTSTVLDSYLSMLGTSLKPIAEDDDADTTTFNSRIKIIVNPGTFVVGASTSGPNSTGPYTLSAAPTATSNDNCDLVFLMRGLTTAQTIANTDCVDTSGPYYEDFYLVYLDAGVPVTIDQNSTALDSYLELYFPSGLFVTANNNRDNTTTDSRISYTPTVSGYFFVGAETNNPNVVGAYTLTVTQASSALVSGGVHGVQPSLLMAMDQMHQAHATEWRARMRTILSSAGGAARRRGARPPG